MKQTLKYAGLSESERSLTIYVEVKTNGSQRIRTLEIPWAELIGHNTLHYIDLAVRRKLMAAWQDPGDLDVRIPGID